jgi:hypothetical protein
MAPGTDSFLSLNSGTSTPTIQLTNGSSKAKGIVVFSGGSAANNLVDVFKTVREDKKCPLSYVIPISDNGGSSSELIRVFGGPGMFILRLQEHKTYVRQVSVMFGVCSILTDLRYVTDPS